MPTEVEVEVEPQLEMKIETEMHVDVVVLGHLAKDRLVFGDRVEYSLGGSVYYGGIVLRRLGLQVAVVTRLHPEDFPLLEELRREGISIFARPAEETSGIENVYEADQERRTCKPLGFAGPFSLEEIPALQARLWLVGPLMAGEVDLKLLEALAERGPLALDAQGFVRVREGEQLVFRDWAEKAQGLRLVAFLKVDQAEAEVLTGLKDAQEAACRLATYGPQEVVLTRGEGVLVCVKDEGIYTAPFRPRALGGRTGRGDTCFAAYLGRRLQGASPEEACKFAAALTSLKLKAPGPFRGSLADVERLLHGPFA